MPDRPPQLAGELVQKFVIAAHRSLDEVKEMHSAEPRLIHACWDWGGGDFETALQGAAHTGQRDIALYLLEHGARLDLPAAVMLGKLDLVKAILAETPDAHKVPGAHGIPLMVHAKMGGESAESVMQYLQTLS